MDPNLIIGAITAATTLIEQLRKIQEARRQNKEMSPEEEAAWDKYITEARKQGHWQSSASR